MENKNLNNTHINDLYDESTTDVNFFSFLDILDCNLELRRYANQSGRWLAEIKHAEIKEGRLLTGNYGTGKTPEQAIEDYVQQIKGKLLVFNATTDGRKEIKVPNNLFFSYR